MKNEIPRKTEQEMLDSGKKGRTLVSMVSAFLLVLAVGLGVYNAPANRLQRQLDLGRRYLEEQNYAQAIVTFDKAIAIDPMNVEAYLCKAEAYIGLDDLQSALETLQTGYDLAGDERLRTKTDEVEARLEQIRQEEQVEMIRVVGMHVDEARKALLDLRLVPEIRYEASEQYGAGTVMQASVMDGLLIDKGTNIILTVAEEKEKSEVGEANEEEKDLEEGEEEGTDDRQEDKPQEDEPQEDVPPDDEDATDVVNGRSEKTVLDNGDYEITEYDADGRVLKYTYYTADGEPDHWDISEYEYGNDGSYAQIVFRYAYGGTMYVSMRYDYDADGNYVKFTQYHADGTLDYGYYP